MADPKPRRQRRPTDHVEALKQFRAKVALENLKRLHKRYYDAASSGRRTQGWRRVSGDGNAATDRGLGIRDTARDLVRNNPWAATAVNVITDHVIGWGITPQLPAGPFADTWAQWAGTTACDADGRRDLDGLARLVLKTVIESGECLVRRRIRRIEDNLPIPLQLQVLEPDFLDETLDRVLPNGGQIIQGVEFSPIGKVEGYWLLPEHPGASRVGVRGVTFGASQRIPASEILHVAAPDRPGQVRAVSWFAPIMLRLKDLDDYEDAALMKQKVAACLSVILTDSTGSGTPLGTADDTTTPGIDSLQPGLIARFSAGDSVEVVQPPSVNEHGPYTQTVLRAIAAGLGIGYEDLTGDYAGMPFSAARMSRIRTWDRVHCHRWGLMIPQFYNPVWNWAVQLAQMVNVRVPASYALEWTAPPMPMLDPAQEGQAYQRNIRSGLQTHSEVLRELGFNPKAVRKELAADFKEFDTLGLLLDSDPRVMTQAGQLQGKAVPKPEPAASPPNPTPQPTDGEDTPAGRARREVAVAFGKLETSLHALHTLTAAQSVGRAESNGHAPAPPVFHVNVDAAAREGAVQVHPAQIEVNVPPSQVENHVDARTTFERGSFEIPVTVEPASVTVHPATVDARTSFEADAIRVHVDAPPPAEVHVDAPVTIAEGAIQIDHQITLPERSVQVDVAAPPPAEVHVDVPVTVQPAEVRVEAPVIHVEPAPPAPARPMRHVVEERDADGNVQVIRDEPLE